MKRLALWWITGFVGSLADQHGCDAWKDVRSAMWEAVEERTLEPSELKQIKELFEADEICQLGAATALAIFGALQPRPEYLVSLQALLRDIFNSLSPGNALPVLIYSDFPFFGALDWLSANELWATPDCLVENQLPVHSQQFQAILQHHLEDATTLPLPSIAAVDFLTKQSAKEQGTPGISSCLIGRAVASLSFLLTHSQTFISRTGFADEALEVLQKAEGLLREERLEGSADDMSAFLERLLSPSWKLSKLLHEISRKVSSRFYPDELANTDEPGCLLLIYTFPTEEIRHETRQALRTLEEHFVSALEPREKPRLVVFVDPETEGQLETDVRPYVSLDVVAAVIPQEELTREMNSYSCQDGLICVSGANLPSGFHRGNITGIQFWSQDYLRISRYTAGPMFLHPQLDSCGQFLKIDTDFFFTERIDHNPLKKMRDEGGRLGWWQMHVQAQRQAGYVQASLDFLEAEELPIRNPRFYVRGRFEQKAKEAGVSLSSLPVADQASTVLYGCLFGGDVQFFREPLYQSFFAFMDEQKGFENHGWSNQFFLGTAAAAFLPRPQLQRIYVSGRHQECHVRVADGNVTEFMRGAEHGMAR